MLIINTFIYLVLSLFLPVSLLFILIENDKPSFRNTPFLYLQGVPGKSR